MEKLDKQDKELIEIAKETVFKGFRNDNIECSVGCALIAPSKKIYSGVNIDIKSSAPTSICAEMGAIAHLAAQGEKKIDTIVSLWISRDYEKNKKWDVFPPCGACRHIISPFGDPWVIISKNEKIKLSKLYPMAG